jgi:hypothetical protein
MNTPFEYVDADDLIQPDNRSSAEKWLDAEIDRRWGNEQGAEPGIVLRAIALDLFTEAVGLRATEQNLRERLAKAAKACDDISADKWALYKGRPPYTGQEPGRASDFTQGQADGADLCSKAIKAMGDGT